MELNDTNAGEAFYYIIAHVWIPQTTTDFTE